MPTTAPYFDDSLLNLGNVLINNTSGTGVSGVDEAAYYGDVSGEESLNALDASLIDQVGTGAGTGFSAYKDLDPSIIGAVSGDLYPSAEDASLINQQGSGATLPSIPAIPLSVSPAIGGPDPYLYFSASQAGPGQTARVTLYLDVTDPNGVPLAALDEAIGYDPDVLQVSNVYAASALNAIASYGTASTVDNQTGVLLVGQAFAGSGLPPVLPYGTDIAVLQLDVTVNADAPVGSETAVTLLQDGTINGQTKFSAISDNEGALTWTAGMAPSNSGNLAIDGSVTVIPVASVVSAIETSVATTLTVVQPHIIQPVRRVMPASAATAVPVTPVNQAGVSTGTIETSVSLVIPLVTDISGTAMVENAIALPLVAAGQPGTWVTNLSVTVALPETAQVATGTAGLTRAGDNGASLSLAALGANKVVPSVSVVTQTIKPSTSTLDEMYRQLGNLSGFSSANGLNAGTVDDGTTDEWSDLWELQIILTDLDSQGKSDEVLQ